MDKIVKRFDCLLFSSIIFSVLDIIVGFMLFKYTNFSMKICMVILGSLITIHGIEYIIRYIYDGLGIKFFAIDLIVGVMAIIVGVFTIFNPFSALTVLGIFAAVWFLINAIEKFYYGIKFMRSQEEIYPLIMFVTILIVVMGVLCLFNPFDSFMLISRLVGLFIICSGLFDIIVVFLFKRRGNEVLKLFK